MAKFTIDGFDFDTATIPQGNIDRLIESAVGHKVRNEASSKARGRLTKDMDEATAKAFKFDRDNEAHASAYAAAQAEIANVIVNGEIGASRGGGGPRMSESDKLAHTYARDRVLGILQSKFKLWCKDGKPIKNKLPPADEVFTWPDGTKRVFGEMIASYKEKNAAEVAKHVNKALADKAKAENAAANAEVNF